MSSITASRMWPVAQRMGQAAAARAFSRSLACERELNQPLSGHEMPRFAGQTSMMRLPVHADSSGLDVCFVGAPMDCGTSYRSGTRLGPRQIRTESAILRGEHPTTGAQPFKSLQVADIGDIPLTPFDVKVAVRQLRVAFENIIKDGCVPLALGGDHTISYPILQAIKAKHGPVALVHVDAHTDTQDAMNGEKIAHGTPFRRAIEEGCLDCSNSVQIGLRGSGYSAGDYDWVKEQGVRVVPANECWHKSLSPLMDEIRAQIGSRPVYLSFDIDGIDPAFAPGTGTPEVGGLTSIQALEIVRGCLGLNLVGADLVEVSPPFDPLGATALLGANLLFEMLCVLPGVHYRH